MREERRRKDIMQIGDRGIPGICSIICRIPQLWIFRTRKIKKIFNIKKMTLRHSGVTVAGTAK